MNKEDLFSLSTNSLKSLNHVQNNYLNTNQLSSNSLNDLNRSSQNPIFSYQGNQNQNNTQAEYFTNGSCSSNNISQTSLNSSQQSDYLQHKVTQQNVCNLNLNNKQFTNLVPVSSQEFQQQLRMSKDFEETANVVNNNMKSQEEIERQKVKQLENKYDEGNEEEEFDKYEYEKEEKSECENVFGTALKDLKQNKNWQQSIIIDSSNQSTFIDNSNESKNHRQQLKSPRENRAVHSSDETSQLPKFNYVSLLLDEYCDKNTSINTEALAFKYLKKKSTTNEANCNSSSQMSLLDFGSINTNRTCFPTSNSTNTILFDTTSSCNQQFQFYQHSFHVNNSNNNSHSISVIQNNLNNCEMNTSKSTVAPRQILDPHHNNNTDLLPSQILGAKKNSNDGANRNNTHESDESENSEADISISSNEDDEVWLFGKPKSSPLVHNKFLDKCDTRLEQIQKYKPLLPLPSPKGRNLVNQKQRRKIQSQQKRNSTGVAINSNGKEKDFSDQDEDVDRDVTTVLDIEKLKRLPKLL